jgi:glucose/arabinose dehydrogenase
MGADDGNAALLKDGSDVTQKRIVALGHRLPSGAA